MTWRSLIIALPFRALPDARRLTVPPSSPQRRQSPVPHWVRSCGFGYAEPFPLKPWKLEPPLPW